MGFNSGFKGLNTVSTGVTSAAYTEMKWLGPAQGKCFSVCSLWTSTLGSCNIMCYINYAKPRSIHMQIAMHIYSPLFEYLSVNSRLHLLACTAQLVFGRSFVFACLYYHFHLRTAALRLIVRSWLGVPTFATRRLHACRHARTPSGGRWNCGREMSGNFA